MLAASLAQQQERLAVIDRAAPIVMIERMRVIILILTVKRLQSGVHDVLMLQG